MPDDQPLVIPAGLADELLALLADNRMIAAIQRLRAATGCELVEAKRWAEDQASSMPVQPYVWKGPPCPYCGKPLRTDQARQCLECGMDWHDPCAPFQR